MTLLLSAGVMMLTMVYIHDVKINSSLTLRKSLETQNKSFINQIASLNPRPNSFSRFTGCLLFDSNNIGEFFISKNYPASGVVVPVYKI